MLRLSCGLRVYARRGAPVTVMSATSTGKEVASVVDMLVLRTRPVVLYSSPVVPYHKFSVIRRPANCRGLLGSTDSEGRVVPGLWHLLCRLYIDKFLAGVREGVPAKRAIIFFKSYGSHFFRVNVRFFDTPLINFKIFQNMILGTKLSLFILIYNFVIFY